MIKNNKLIKTFSLLIVFIFLSNICIQINVSDTGGEHANRNKISFGIPTYADTPPSISASIYLPQPPSTTNYSFSPFGLVRANDGKLYLATKQQYYNLTETYYYDYFSTANINETTLALTYIKESSKVSQSSTATTSYGVYIYGISSYSTSNVLLNGKMSILQGKVFIANTIAGADKSWTSTSTMIYEPYVETMELNGTVVGFGILENTSLGNWYPAVMKGLESTPLKMYSSTEGNITRAVKISNTQALVWGSGLPYGNPSIYDVTTNSFVSTGPSITMPATTYQVLKRADGTFISVGKDASGNGTWIIDKSSIGGTTSSGTWGYAGQPITKCFILNDNSIILVGQTGLQILKADETLGAKTDFQVACSSSKYSMVISSAQDAVIYLYGNTLYKVYINQNISPSMSVIQPIQNEIFSQDDSSYISSINVTDTDNDTLTCKYYIDSETIARDTITVSDTATEKTVVFNPFNVGELTEGNHTIKFEVSDSINSPVQTSINIRIDKSAPDIITLTTTSTITDITIAGVANDSMAGLDEYPYRYTIGTNEPTAWITNTSYTQDGLIPNTQYNVTFEAKDAVGNIATTTSSVYTKAASPSLNINNITPYSCNINTLDNNSTNTQYQISVNDGAQYITPEGTLTTSPVWITLLNKNITVTGLSPSTTYTFTAKAKNDEGIETAWSAPISGTTLVQPPSAPVNTTAVATSSSISVVWDPVASSTGYDIEVDGTIIDNGTYTSYNHMGLTPYTQHTYRVRAKNEGGTGAWSEEISKYTQQDTPLTPFNIDAAATNTSVIVTWQPILEATAYDIEVDGIVINNSSSTNYVHTGLLSGTMHGYRVRSINSGGKSDWSNEILVSTLTDTPIVPSNISATPGSGQITVAWDAIPGATYEIEVDGNIKDNSTSNSFVHTGLLAGSSHSYRVRTNQSGSLSDWSVAVTATIPIEEFGTPKNIKTEATDTTVTMSWSPVVDATGYDVEVDGIVLDNGTDTACIFNSLTTNTQYTYRLRAKGTDKVSDWSEPIAVTTFALPTPSNIISAATETSISLTWDTLAGAESYELDIDGQLIEGITTNSYIHEGLASNTQHSYRIRAKNASGTSNWSSIINEATLSNALDAPTGIIVKSMTSSIQLVWKPVPEVDSYEVEIDGTTVENVTAATYIHSGLTAGTQHSYRVRAIKNTVPGSWSNTAIAFTLPDTPLTPTNIAVSSTMSSILVTWDGVDNAIEYEIEVDGVLINAGLNTKYLHNNLTPDSTHTYRVRANSSVAQSPWSEVITTNTKSSVNTYTLSVSNGQVFNLMFTANEIVDPTNYTYTITYNPDELEMLDLCALTSRIDLNTGNLIGTDIQIVQFTQGTIVFKKLGDSTGQAWTGLVNSIKFKGKIDGESQITYSIQ
ncbi:MAG: fibronectin type III domain-containing protein [Lutisporaceae bacterium]